MEYLTAVDRSLFLLINHLPHNWLFEMQLRADYPVSGSGDLYGLSLLSFFFSVKKNVIIGFFCRLFSRLSQDRLYRKYL